MSSELEQIRQRYVESAGHLSQSIGLGRSLGQIFMHIYLSPEPQTLDDLTRELEISKGGASMAVRQLEQWGAVRRVWIKGRRKDYYEASEDFGRVIRKALLDVIGRRMEVTDGLIEDAEKVLAGKNNGDKDWKFMKRRIRKLRTFRDRARWIWDRSIVKLLLK